MSKSKKLFAKPVSRVVALDTSDHVGWLYRWNDGTTHMSWLKEHHCRVAYVPLKEAECFDGPPVMPATVAVQHEAEH